MTPINQAAPDPPDEGSLLNACERQRSRSRGLKGVNLLRREERVRSTAALKVTMRRGGGDRRRDELWRGRGGSEKSFGCRHEAPHSPIPRALGGDSWPDPAPRCKPRNPLTFTISGCGHGRRRPARGPLNTPTNFSQTRCGPRGTQAVRTPPRRPDPRIPLGLPSR